MLPSIHHLKPDLRAVETTFGEASFPLPFKETLEYSSPARGVWNIVHTGFLVPEAHQIFVCASGCLRGVVLTATEMNALDRFHSILLTEEDLLNGTLEELILDGVADILRKLPKHPPAILLFTACIHHFAGCDLPYVYDELRRRFPDIDFTDCYMNPILRKSGLTPDQLMREQLYSLLLPREKKENLAVLLGSDFALDEDSELRELFRSAGWELRSIQDCRSYEEYLRLAEASLFVSIYPSAKAGAKKLAERLHTPHLHLPLSFSYDRIHEELGRLAEELHTALPNEEKRQLTCEKRFRALYDLIGDFPIALDYTAYPAPLSLARFLLERGFHVTTVYADTLAPSEEEDFLWIREHRPSVRLLPTVHPSMRFAAPPIRNDILAIGQKAAHFSGTEHFVNIAEGGGAFGYSALLHLADAMEDAYHTTKNMERLIQQKGFLCETCL